MGRSIRKNNVVETPADEMAAIIEHDADVVVDTERTEAREALEAEVEVESAEAAERMTAALEAAGAPPVDVVDAPIDTASDAAEQLQAEVQAEPVDTTPFEVGAINCYAQPITLVGKDAEAGQLLQVTGEAELAAVLGLKSGWFIDGDKVERHHVVDFAVRNVATGETALYRRIKNEAGEKVAVRVEVALEQADEAAGQAEAGETVNA